MAIVLAFACAMVYGVGDYCGGRATRSAPSVYVSIVGQVTSLILATTAVVVVGTDLAGARDLGFGAAAGVAGAVALTSFYHALSHGSMTVVAPITAVTSAVIPVVFGLASGERPGVLAYVGMLAAVLAVTLVSGAVGERHTVTRRSTIAFAVVAGLGFAFIFIAFGEVQESAGIWPLVSARCVSIPLIAVFALAGRTAMRGHGRGWTLAVAAGALDMSANILYLLAVQRGLLSVVVVIVALYPVSTVCLAFGLDRERVSTSQAIGMACALGALVLVSVSGT